MRSSLLRRESGGRARMHAALLPARQAAWGPGEYVGQEDYMTASQALTLAGQAGVKAGTRVLDLCCGAGGIALHLVERTGCRLLGVDIEHEAARLAAAPARQRRLDGRARFVVAEASALPLRSQFEAVLLFDSFLSIRDKAAVLAEIRRCLQPGGRMALRLEEGSALTEAERQRLPGGDGAFMVTEDELRATLTASGFRVVMREDHSQPSAALVGRLLGELHHYRDAIEATAGKQAWEEARVSAALWEEWLRRGRARLLGMVVERTG